MTAIIVVFLFCLLYTVAIVAQERDRKSAGGDAANARTEVSRLGFGQRVNVKLTDGRKANGRLTGFANNHFVVTDSKGAASAIAYSQVFRIKKQKEKLGVFHAPWQAIMFTAAGVGTAIVATLGLFD